MAYQMSDERALAEIKKRSSRAKRLLKNEDKMEKFLQRLEKKLKLVPFAGGKLAIVPVFISMLRSYLTKEYEDMPLGTIVAIISALIYFLSPIDIIPDAIPLVGMADDAIVVHRCWKLVESDVEEYRAWRRKNKKIQ